MRYVIAHIIVIWLIFSIIAWQQHWFAPAPVTLYTAPDPTALRLAVEHEFSRQISQRMACQQYPDLLDGSSALSEAVQAREQALRDNGDQQLDGPDWPLELAEEEAVKLGILPQAPVVWRKW